MLPGRLPLSLFVVATCVAGSAFADDALQLYHGEVSTSAESIELKWSHLEGPAPAPAQPSSAAPERDPQWTAFELDALHREKRDLHIARPALAVAFSVLGFAGGTWMLAVGIEANQDPRDYRISEGEWYIGRPAPYAGTVLMGISVLGLARAAKKLRDRAKRRRELNRRIASLAAP